MKQADVRVGLIALTFAGFAASTLALEARGAKASDAISDYEQRALFAQCDPVDLVVEDLWKKKASEIGLTEEAVVNAAESRLRAARLFEPKSNSYLYVNVILAGGYGFGVFIKLKRYLNDLGYGFPGTATVWDAGTAGTHGADGQYVLGIVSQLMDIFLTAYLRANEKACAAK